MTDTTRIAVITGAGSGIGRAVAIQLARDGFVVVLAGRRQQRLEATATEIADYCKASNFEVQNSDSKINTDRTRVIPTDVADADAVASLFDTVRTEFGRIDLLFNNAGIGAPPVPMEELTLEQWRAVVDTNLTGPFLCTRAAMRIMKTQAPRGGRIINNGSISAHTPRPFSAPYTATKHAITGLTKSTALDGRAFDIACGQIDIGNAATPMTARMAGGVLQPSGELAAEATMAIDPVARAVSYMASLPLDANVMFMTVMATQMPFAGRG